MLTALVTAEIDGNCDIGEWLVKRILLGLFQMCHAQAGWQRRQQDSREDFLRLQIILPLDVWTSAVLTPRDFALALAGFFLLSVWKMPPGRWWRSWPEQVPCRSSSEHRF